MVSDRAARGGTRGGPGISPPRPQLAGLIAGLAALAVGVVIAWLSLDLRSRELLAVSWTLAVVAVIVLVVAVVAGRTVMLVSGVAMLALIILAHVFLTGAPALDELAFVGVGLLLVAELGQWSFDSRRTHVDAVRIHLSRGIGIAALVVLGGLTALLCVVVVGLPLSTGDWAIAVAVAATVGLLALISNVAVRSVDAAAAARSSARADGARANATDAP